MKGVYKREDILKAERMLKDYEVYLREMEILDKQEEMKKKKSLFNENLIRYKLKSQDDSMSITMLKNLSKKLMSIENKIGGLRDSVSINTIFKQNVIFYDNSYKIILPKLTAKINSNNLN